MYNAALRAAWITLLSVSVSAAQEFPQIVNTEPEPSASPLPAAAAAADWQLPAGFEVGVFASEPDVQNPIDMAWDPRGRLWIAENYTYAERSQRFDLTLRDRVLVFEDADGDGRADRRHVFTDQVQMLTSVEVGRGGVWLMCPPQLLFIPDADRDDHPDGPAEVVLDGFEVAKENYHNFANGLRWGPDGWLYGRCGGSCPGRIGRPGTPDDQRVALRGGIWRFQPKTGQFEVLTHGTTNPWGHDWNEFGDGFFINTVNGHLWQLIPGAHLVRPFTLDPNPDVYELIDMHADHWHFDTGTTWQDSRDGAANSFGGGHAHCGMMIYLGGSWPADYRGRLLTWNIHGRRANQEILERHGSGYVGRHGPDMLLSADPFFRGMELSYGPSGDVYVIDWSDTGECHEHTGVHRTSGRIYRVSHTAAAPVANGPASDLRRHDLYQLSSRELAALMSHQNVWFVRQARHVLAERAAAGRSDVPSAVAYLQRLIDGQADPLTAYRALVTLHAMGLTDAAMLRPFLQHSNEHLRAWAVRLLTDRWPLDDVFGPTNLPPEVSAKVAAESGELLDSLCEVAARDSSSLVRLALASTLQRLPVDRRAPLAQALLDRAEDEGDHNLPLLVWYGLIPLAQADPLALAKLAVGTKWAKTQQLIARRLAGEIDDHPEAVEHLLAFAAGDASLAQRRNLLVGVADGLHGWRRARRPKNWPRLVETVKRDREAELSGLVRELSVLFGDGRALAEVQRIVLDESAEIGVRRSALETLVDRRGEDTLQTCLTLLGDGRLNAIAARGLEHSDDPRVAAALIRNYRRFRGPERPRVIEILASRQLFADSLLDAVEAGRIPVADLTAFDVRQIRSLGSDALRGRVAALWGNVRESPREKLERIGELKQQLLPALGAADLSGGRELFNQSCAKCHRLFGQGEAIGPDLTGSNRTNIDYLLENIIDPSAVVSKDFRMTVIQTVDGRVLNGLVLTRNDKTLRLQTQTEQRTLNLEEIDEMRQTLESPMPAGLFDNLSSDQIRDLVAYLMHPTQVALLNAGDE